MKNTPVKIDFVKEKGHTGIVGNERADQIDKRQLVYKNV